MMNARITLDIENGTVSGARVNIRCIPSRALPGPAELFYQATVVATRYHATVDEIGGLFHPYFTMAEAPKLTAQTFNKDVKNLSCCSA